MKALSYFIMAFTISLCVVPFAQAVEINDLTEERQMDRSPMTTMISGLVKDVQGDWCIVQDSQGIEWRIQVDDHTDTIGHVLPGVTVTAMVESDGHAQQVKVLPDS